MIVLTLNGIIASLKARSKRDALQKLAGVAAEKTGIDACAIFNAILQRERLGSTGLGCGIAIPHVKLNTLHGIIGLFARLEAPIEYESHDGEPVDLVFMLLSPENASGDHLEALVRISRLVREPTILDELRDAPDAVALHSALTVIMTSHA